MMRVEFFELFVRVERCVMRDVRRALRNVGCEMRVACWCAMHVE